jgi:hypothetical protein
MRRTAAMGRLIKPAVAPQTSSPATVQPRDGRDPIRRAHQRANRRREGAGLRWRWDGCQFVTCAFTVTMRYGFPVEVVSLNGVHGLDFVPLSAGGGLVHQATLPPRARHLLQFERCRARHPVEPFTIIGTLYAMSDHAGQWATRTVNGVQEWGTFSAPLSILGVTEYK